MKALDRKLLRDSARLTGQILTIALVMASGIAVFISSLSAYHSLSTSQDLYYAESRFADVFAGLKRAPLSLVERIAAIPGVAQVEARLVFDVTLSVEGVTLPVSGRMIALPPNGAPDINRLRLIAGRPVAPDRLDELMVNKAFADANRLKPGDAITAVLNGRRQEFRIAGTFISPEFVFATGPGEPLPDDRRFGVFFVAHDVLAHAFAMEGAFNDVALAVAPGANLRAIMAQLDQLLDRWGGMVAHDRSQQPSHRFLQDELKEQGTMAATIPPIFLLVAAFLLHVVLGRLVATQREQIATLKALGYGREVGWHFAKFAALVIGLGVLLGVALGAGFGRLMLESYRPFFRFPELVFDLRPWTALLAAAIAFASGMAGALGAVRAVERLQPAEAMRPPAPPAYSSRLGAGWRRAPARWMMAARGLTAHPLRATLTFAGVVAAAPLVLMSTFWTDALDHMIDVQFAAAERADAVVGFIEPLPARVTREVARMPGVLIAEPLRTAPVRLRAGARSYETGLQGVSDEAQLRRILDVDLAPLSLQTQGLLLSRRLAERLGVRVGDTIGVDILEGRRLRVEMPVAGLVNDLIGLSAYAGRDHLDRILQEDSRVSAVAVRLDPAQEEAFYAAVKRTPMIAALSLKERSIRNFRDTAGAVVLLFAAIFTTFAITIAFGVVYNSARIAFHERSVELATLRILGFSRAETARILFAEIALEVCLAIPLGLVAGYWLIRLLLRAFETEMFEIPPVIAPYSYAVAGLIVAGSAIVSMGLIARQLWRLDLVAVLKTRV